MANANSTRARGLEVEHYHWGCWAKGTREDLIQDGYAQKDGPFPGDPGEKKTSLKTTDPKGRAIAICRSSKYLFVVRRHWSDEEKVWYERRQAQEKESERVARQQELEIERATGLVASWPKTASAFREMASRWASLYLVMLEEKLVEGEGGGGFRYDPETARKIEQHVDGLLDLVETGTVVMDFEARKQATPACLAGASQRAVDPAKQDNIFQLHRVK